MTRTKQQRPRHILDPTDKGDSTVTSDGEQSSSDGVSDLTEVDESLQGQVTEIRDILPPPPPLRRDDSTPVSNISSCGDEGLPLPAKSYLSPRSLQSVIKQENISYMRTDEKYADTNDRFNLKSERQKPEIPLAYSNVISGSYTHLDYFRYLKEVMFNMRNEKQENITNGFGTIKNIENHRSTTPPYGDNTDKVVDNANTNRFANKAQHEPLWQHMFHPMQLLAKFILQSQKNNHTPVENRITETGVPIKTSTNNDNKDIGMSPKLCVENDKTLKNEQQNTKQEIIWNTEENLDSDEDMKTVSRDSNKTSVTFRPYLPIKKDSNKKHEITCSPIDNEQMTHSRKGSRGEEFQEIDVASRGSSNSKFKLEPSPQVVRSDEKPESLTSKSMDLTLYKRDETVSHRQQKEIIHYNESESRQQSNTLAIPSHTSFNQGRERKITSPYPSSDSRLSVSPVPHIQRRSKVGSPYHPYSNYSPSILPASSQTEIPPYVYNSSMAHSPHLPLQLPFTQIPEFSPIPSPAYYNPWAMVYPPFHSGIDPAMSNPFMRRRFQHELPPLPMKHRYAMSPGYAQSRRPHTPASASIKSDTSFRKRSSMSRNKIHSNSALDSLHAAIVREAKEMNKGMDPENMYIECPICHKKIKRLYHFQRHMRIHSGEKSHTCPFCPYKSVRKDNLKSHMKTHEKGKYDTTKRPQMRRENSGRHAFPLSRDFLIADDKGILRSNSSQRLCEPVSPVSANNSLHLTPFSDNNLSLSESMSPASTSNDNHNEVTGTRHSPNGGDDTVSQKLLTAGLKTSTESYNGYAPLVTTPFAIQERDFHSISNEKKPRILFHQNNDSYSSDPKFANMFRDDRESSIELKFKDSEDFKRKIHSRVIKRDFHANGNFILENRKRQNSSEELRQSKAKSQKIDIPTWYKTNMGKNLLSNTNNCNNKDTKPFAHYKLTDSSVSAAGKYLEPVPRTMTECENISKNRILPDVGDEKYFIEQRKNEHTADTYQNGETANRNFNFKTSNAYDNSLQDETEYLKKIPHSITNECGKDVSSDLGRLVDSNRDTPTSERRSSDEEGVGTRTTNVKKFFHSTEEKLPSPTLPQTTQLPYSLGTIFKNHQSTVSSDDNIKRRVNSCWLGAARESKCRLCDFVASSNSSLQEHMATHREDGLYKCQQCDYHGKNLSKLIEHIRIHTGERPFQCDQCSYAAKRKDNLAQHKSVRHDKNRFKGSSKTSKNALHSDSRALTISPKEKASKYRETEYKSLLLPSVDHFSSAMTSCGDQKARDNWHSKYDYRQTSAIDSNTTVASSFGLPKDTPTPLNSYVFPTHPFLTGDSMSTLMYRHPLMAASMFHAMPSLPASENPMNNTAVNYASRFTNSPQYNETLGRNPHLTPGGNKFSTTLEECAR